MACHDVRLVVQAEYVDTSTLETRLQNVARRMVSTPRRSEAERPPSSTPQQNGYIAGEVTSRYPPSASARIFNGANNLVGPSGVNAPQESSLLPSGSAAMPSSSAPGLGMPGPGNSQFMQHPGMPMHSAGGLGSSRMVPGQVGDSTSLGLLGGSQIKADAPPTGSLGMGGVGAYPMNTSHPNFIRGQNQPGPGPVMSNGAPVLLRASRDWVPGQSTSMLNVRMLQSAYARTKSISSILRLLLVNRLHATFLAGKLQYT
jgi:hypothetical protein